MRQGAVTGRAGGVWRPRPGTSRTEENPPTGPATTLWIVMERMIPAALIGPFTRRRFLGSPWSPEGCPTAYRAGDVSRRKRPGAVNWWDRSPPQSRVRSVMTGQGARPHHRDRTGDNGRALQHGLRTRTGLKPIRSRALWGPSSFGLTGGPRFRAVNMRLPTNHNHSGRKHCPFL